MRLKLCAVDRERCAFDRLLESLDSARHTHSSIDTRCFYQTWVLDRKDVDKDDGSLGFSKFAAKMPRKITEIDDVHLSSSELSTVRLMDAGNLLVNRTS